MSNALATLTSLPISAPKTDLSKYGGEMEFLPRIQLVTKGKYVDKGKISPGHYGVPDGDDDITDLGESIDILPLAVRDKALDTTEDPPLAVFDAEDPVFQDIAERAGEKDSGCMFGPSFLVFERNSGKFYEFFCGNKSGRMEAGKFSNYLPVSEAEAEQFGIKAQPPQPLTLRAKYIERPRYSWHAPQVTKCSTPFTNLPAIEKVVDEITKFLNPKAADVEVAEGGRAR
ncbi:MAG: hypothetical protein MN733_40550 [Nitrososphaera sp.]|nr:hypothetical protein [Nitrososphaera sp.]